jgi:hypothetical protein
MPIPTYLVLDGDGGSNTPLRPTAEPHFGGLGFVNHPTFTPTDTRRPSAQLIMQMTRSIERAFRVMPSASIDVNWSGSALSILGLVSSSNEAAFQASINLAHPGTGRFTITWTAGMLPPRTLLPRAVVLNHAGLKAHAFMTSANVCEVNVADTTIASLVDTACKFSVDIYGEGT